MITCKMLKIWHHLMVRREAKFENGYIGVRSWRLNLVLYLISLADEVTHWRTRLHICQRGYIFANEVTYLPTRLHIGGRGYIFALVVSFIVLSVGQIAWHVMEELLLNFSSELTLRKNCSEVDLDPGLFFSLSVTTVGKSVILK